MSEVPPLITDLALILVVAGAVTLLFKKLKQPLVLGYIVAGFLVSPHMPYTASVTDRADVQIWADIGVMFLLFSLGLDFSFKKIIKMGTAPMIAASVIIFCMLLLGFTVGNLFGWSRMDCIFLGGMLAMSSTTIIYKAFDDMGLMQQKFTQMVMSVLILEDILAIVMMVMLSAIASGGSPDGGELLGSVLRIGFFLVLWFVVGIFLIPLLFRSTRKLMTNETMVIIALGLCCAMAVISTMVGFSSAFGAFVMGSIIAETIEAEKIEKLVEPVKNLFGAVFFVSVGMLVDPQILVSYAVPIVLLVLTILFGQAIFGSLGYLLSGQSLKTAMRCGFSMAQIGEFAFIIASLGLSLGVISDFLYPVVVAVSVITTFLTPYMIRAAVPCYELLERRLPRKWIRRLNHLSMSRETASNDQSQWKSLLMQMGRNTLIYCILSIAIIWLMSTFAKPLLEKFIPEVSVPLLGCSLSTLIYALTTILLISPFLRALVMKKNHSPEVKTLWSQNRHNRTLVSLTILVRIIIACCFIYYVLSTELFSGHVSMLVVVTLALMAIMIMSRGLKQRSIKLERLFVQNLRSREIEAQVHGKKRPLYEGRLLDRNIHFSIFEIPMESKWAGKTLKELALGQTYGVHVSSILRGQRRINIPSGNDIVLPMDKIEAIGNDEQLTALDKAIKTQVFEDDPDVEKREMKLQQIVVRAGSPLIGKTLSESGLRSTYGLMVVGLDEGDDSLTNITPQRRFEQGDIVWVVGEERSLAKVASAK